MGIIESVENGFDNSDVIKKSLTQRVGVFKV